jgi:thiol:disulfide interchange protein DsbD
MSLSGNPLNYIFAFFAGVWVSFTPCVYPLIPITVGYIGIKGTGQRAKGFILSLIYVTGIAITYSGLGILASLTGQIFGKISVHPLTNIIVGFIILLFGLSLFEVFNLRFPIFSRNITYPQKGYLATFILGLSSGLIISPCVTPVLGSILIFVASRANVLYGATLLLTFAYGMGLMLILVGTFSSLLFGLPKSGMWLAKIKKMGGLILVGMGVYFIFRGIIRLL